MKINLEVKKLGKFFFKSQKLLKRIGYYGYLKANKPIPFEFNSKTYFSNPDRSAINHIERSVQKISNLSNMIHFEPRVVFDVGANCGLFSAFVAEKYPNCNIFCFEPSEELIPIIKMNCNRYNVSIYDCAVSDTDGSVTFYVNPDSQQTNSVNVQAVKVVSAVDQILETGTVKCRSLDSIVEENKIDQVDVLKVDVQGFEGAVFRGGANMLKKVNLIFVELILGGLTLTACESKR